MQPAWLPLKRGVRKFDFRTPSVYSQQDCFAARSSAQSNKTSLPAKSTLAGKGMTAPSLAQNLRHRSTFGQFVNQRISIANVAHGWIGNGSNPHPANHALHQCRIRMNRQRLGKEGGHTDPTFKLLLQANCSNRSQWIAHPCCPEPSLQFY